MAWSFKSLAVFALTAIALVAGAQQPMFKNRAVNSNAQPGDVPPCVRDQYNAIQSERSLLIPFCPLPDMETCPGGAFYSLESLFSIAATLAHIDPQKARGQWFQQATSGASAPFGNSVLALANILQSFQLLAVVNRMDLGVWGSKGAGQPEAWSNAELRFIYGLKPLKNPGRFTLIVEFVLPDMGWTAFRDQASQWKALGPPSVTANSLQRELARVIEQTGYRNAATVRLRANCDVGGKWRFSEWVFHGAAGTSPGSFELSDLDFQVNNAYMQPTLVTDRATSAEATQRFETYATFWEATTDPSSPVSVDPKMAVKTADYSFSQQIPFLSPPPTLAYSTLLGLRRNVIALQQCTGCHARETNTNLQHVSESGDISRFLLPNRKAWNPTLEDLTLPCSDATCATLDVPIQYCSTITTRVAPSGNDTINCPSPTQPTSEHRRFHDLARRKLFMATVLDTAGDTPRPGDVDHIMAYAPDFVH
jgi:hypothetical protein